MVAFATSSRAEALGAQHYDEQIKHLTAQVDTLFGNTPGRAQACLIDAVVSSFDHNKYIKGAYRLTHVHV